MVTYREAVRSTTTASTIALYLSSKLTTKARLDAAHVAGSVIVRGETGARDGRILRVDGFTGPLRLDPADWENHHSRDGQPDLWGEDPWLAEQRSLEPVELVSPGGYVRSDDFEGLARSIERELAWLDHAGAGRLALTLDWTWLTNGLGRLVSALADTARPVCIALSDPKDPLGHEGAVPGLIELIAALDDVMINRCDAGALGGVANGASVGAVGTGGSVRHAVEPGKKPGGSGVNTPSALVADLLMYKHPTVLARLPSGVKPLCHLDCCGGQALDRFALDGTTAELYHHNHLALAHLGRRLLAIDVDQRPEWFRELAVRAVAEAARIARDGKQPFTTSDQVVAWARSRSSQQP